MFNHTLKWLLGLILFLFFISHIYTTNKDHMWTFDESVYLRLAYQLKNSQPYSTLPLFQDAAMSGRQLPEYLARKLFIHPPLFAQMIRFSYLMLEYKDAHTSQELYTVGRFIPILSSILTLWLVYLLGSRIFNPGTALLACFLLCLELNFWICAQKIWIASFLNLLVWLTIFLYLKAADNTRWYLPAGLVFGLALSAKYTALVVLIVLGYTFVIFRRRDFKTAKPYLGLFISLLVFIPWIQMNYQAYGYEMFANIIHLRKIDAFYFWLPLLLIFPALLFILNKPTVWMDKTRLTQRILPAAALGMAAAFWGYLLLQPDVRESFCKALTWGEYPKSGWSINFFRKEPWYFYFKQLPLYTPFHFVTFTAGLTAWKKCLQGKNSEGYTTLWICALCSLWMGILWKNYQGRYIIVYAPAAMLIAADAIMACFRRINQSQDPARKYLLTGFAAVFLWLSMKSAATIYHSGILLNDAYY
ncbi:MAG: glycosyltransferase family 39 protein [Candidatus Omnitrophica bacterium]|nr:glycosyltransferase family 39 protein [Candidatus Omnitrophota bacterium]